MTDTNTKTWEVLSRDPTYPCAKCKNVPNPIRCTNRSCAAWKRWVRRDWASMQYHAGILTKETLFNNSWLDDRIDVRIDEWIREIRRLTGTFTPESISPLTIHCETPEMKYDIKDEFQFATGGVLYRYAVMDGLSIVWREDNEK